MKHLVISACLLGEPCRYDGLRRPHPESLELADRARRAGVGVVAVCPEVLGGLAVPRPGAQLFGGDGRAVLEGKALVLITDSRKDVTCEFVSGAKLALAKAKGSRLAILKSRSPSCGWGVTEIDLELKAGDGVFAALLRQEGIFGLTDEELAANPGRVDIR